jgi:ribosome maturation protein SDO1
MTDTVARLRSGKLTFETMVNLEEAIKLKRGENVDINEVIRDTQIYTELKKGMRAGKEDLMKSFGTANFIEVVEKIVKKGNLEVTQEYRDEEIENKKKQIIDFLSRNAIDARTNRPFTASMVESSLKQSGVKIENKPIEKQIPVIIDALRNIIPIKIETKKLKIKIPAEHTGRAYGIVQEYKERENWLPDGSLEVVVNIPVGMQSQFYDKLNGITHGSAITSEIKEN